MYIYVCKIDPPLALSKCNILPSHLQAITRTLEHCGWDVLAAHLFPLSTLLPRDKLSYIWQSSLPCLFLHFHKQYMLTCFQT